MDVLCLFSLSLCCQLVLRLRWPLEHSIAVILPCPAFANDADTTRQVVWESGRNGTTTRRHSRQRDTRVETLTMPKRQVVLFITTDKTDTMHKTVKYDKLLLDLEDNKYWLQYEI